MSPLSRLIFSLCLILATQACGNKGPLYLPAGTASDRATTDRPAKK